MVKSVEVHRLLVLLWASALLGVSRAFQHAGLALPRSVLPASAPVAYGRARIAVRGGAGARLPFARAATRSRGTSVLGAVASASESKDILIVGGGPRFLAIVKRPSRSFSTL
jgi:hypothetical protein